MPTTGKTGRVVHVTRRCMPPMSPMSKSGQYKVFKIFSFRDITDIYYLERHKEETMNMLAHDIRNPILATTQSLDNVIQGVYGELDERKSFVMAATRNTCELLLAMSRDTLKPT